MTHILSRAMLLAGTGIAALVLPTLAQAAEPADATTDRVVAGTSTKGSKGQANDVDSLSSADIVVTGTAAASQAPITTSLTTTQPQSVVGRELIDNVLPVTSDFNQIAVLTPGVTITGTSNGIGLSESKVQIRGFQDGEYNVTYDSVPFSDTNNPTHHSTSFFPSNTIESVIVNRGPGNASQLGQATYGGNLNIYSRAVADDMGGRADLSYGSFNTVVARAEFQSGKLAKLGDIQFVLTGQFLKSDGALTGSPTSSKNIFFKAIVPIGASNTLTLLSTYNRNYYYQSDTGSGTCGNTVGATTAIITEITGENCSPTSLIGTYGKNYGLVADANVINTVTNGNSTTVPSPFAQAYYKYNRTDKTTDFSIIRLQSDLGNGFTLDNRVYMYAYTNNTFSGNDTTGRTTGVIPASAPTPAITTQNVVVKTPGGPNSFGIPGYDKGNKYRTYGYIGQVNYEFAKGRARVGGWYEFADTNRRLLNLDMLTGLPSYREAVVTNADGTTQPRNVRYLQDSTWKQYQLFAEIEYEVLPGLLVTPGIKYVHFTRGINASVNQTSRTLAKGSATWTKTLPFLTANYTIMPDWTVYFQYAKGMYVPDLSSFYAPSGSAAQQATLATALGNLQPQTSTNYQLGTVYHGKRVTLDFDVYKIDVDNKIAGNPDPAFPGTLINIGSVRYKGIEGGVTYSDPSGLTVFANGSLSEGKSLTTGAQISRAAKVTAAAGILYQHNGLNIAYTQKLTGATYANEYNGLPGSRLYRINPYSIGDFNISYKWDRFRVGVQVSNVLDNRSISAIGTNATGASQTATAVVPNLPGATAAVRLQNGYGPWDTLLFNPPRAITGSIRVEF
jgi:iron complex outermembrane recepter protein